MPYIKSEDRNKVLDSGKAETAGELNFLVTLICGDYLATKGTNYQVINDIIGALEGAKIEFYRRIVAQYEDKKAQENGDVY